MILPKLITGALGARRTLAPEWVKWKRLARQARRDGYGRVAEKAYAKFMEEKAGSPAILRQEYRQAKEQIAAKRAQQDAALKQKAKEFLDMYGGPQVTQDEEEEQKAVAELKPFVAKTYYS